jgi:hypothetical protein
MQPLFGRGEAPISRERHQAGGHYPQPASAQTAGYQQQHVKPQIN